MKKCSSVIILLLVVVLAFGGVVYAESTEAPPPADEFPDLDFAVIVKDLQDSAVETNTTLHLRIEAVSPGVGSLSYQWYYSYSRREDRLISIPGETTDHLSVDLTFVGDIYYCCAVWNSYEGRTCGPVYSTIAKYKVVEHLSDLDVISVEIQCRPDKRVYLKGEELDPTGLRVYVFNSLGFTEYVDGKGVTLSGYDKDRVGKQTITVSCEGKSDSFEVTVNDTANTANDAADNGEKTEDNKSTAERPTGTGKLDNSNNTGNKTNDKDVKTDTAANNENKDKDKAPGSEDPAKAPENDGTNSSEVTETEDVPQEETVPENSDPPEKETVPENIETPEDVAVPEDGGSHEEEQTDSDEVKPAGDTARIAIIASTIVIAVIALVYVKRGKTNRGGHHYKR